MNNTPATPSKLAASISGFAKKLRSRQEAVATVWVTLALALVSALLQLWPVVVLLLPVAGYYWIQIRRTDQRKAWAIPLQLASLGSDLARVLVDTLLKIALMVVLPVVGFSGLVDILASDDPASKALGWAALVAVALGLVALIVLSRKTAFLSWRTLGLTSLVVVPAFFYVLWDDAEFDHPLTLAGLSPPPAQAAASWETTLWFNARDGHPALHQISGPGFAVIISADDAEKSIARLDNNREKIHAGWASLRTEHEWIAALNAFPVIADLTTAHDGGSWNRYAAYRVVVQSGCAEAGLLALEGKGDDAIGVLLPLIDVSRKLEPSTRSLSRGLTARVGLRQLVDAVRFVLARAPVSQEKRAALAAALATGTGGAAGIQHLLWLEYAWNFEHFFQQGLTGLVPDSWAQWSLYIIVRPFYLIRATANGEAAYIAKVADLAGRREPGAFAAGQKELATQQVLSRFKNPFGNLVFAISKPDYTRTVEVYWKSEDARLALIADLRNPPSAAAR